MWRVRFLLLLLLLVAPTAWTLDISPGPKAHVNDYAGMLSLEERSALEQRLRQYESESSSQLVIAIFPDLGGEDVDDFTNRQFEKWKLGAKNLDNGVLIAVFQEDRQVRIEVGYGLEGRLTDATAAKIIRDDITPAFRTGKYAAGLNAAITSIEKATAGEYQAPEKPQAPGVLNDYSAVMFILFLLLMVYLSRRNRGIFLPGPGYHRNGGYLPPVFFPQYRDRDSYRDGGGFSSGGFSGGGGMSGGGGASGSW